MPALDGYVSRSSSFGAALVVLAVACGGGSGRLADAGTTGPDPAAPTMRASSPEPVTVERRTLAMGTVLRAKVAAADRASGLAAIEDAFQVVRILEERLSTWSEGSELTRLNRTPVEQPFRLSAGLDSLLAEARRWSVETGGAFEPVVGALVDAWDLRGAGRRPTPWELEAALSATGTGAIRFDDGERIATRRHPEAWIDAGGFGKGAALADARRSLNLAGVRRALLDFGGQILAVGAGDRGVSGWPVSVAHPGHRGESVAELRLRDASVATSGASERGVEVEGRRVGHLLDPRTGRPVDPWGSVTVVARDPLAADALSTALFAMGPDEGMEWAAGRTDVGVLFVILRDEDHLRFRWNRAMEPWMKREPGARLESADRRVGSAAESAVEARSTSMNEHEKGER